jgi:hypothetical protein
LHSVLVQLFVSSLILLQTGFLIPNSSHVLIHLTASCSCCHLVTLPLGRDEFTSVFFVIEEMWKAKIDIIASTSSAVCEWRSLVAQVAEEIL